MSEKDKPSAESELGVIVVLAQSIATVVTFSAQSRLGSSQLALSAAVMRG